MVRMGRKGWIESCQVWGTGAEGEERAGSGGTAGEGEGVGWGEREWGGELGPKISSLRLCSQAWETHLPEALCLACLSQGFQSQPGTPTPPVPGTGPGLPTRLLWRARMGTVCLPSWGSLWAQGSLCVTESRNRSWESKTSYQACPRSVSELQSQTHLAESQPPHAHLTM